MKSFLSLLLFVPVLLCLGIGCSEETSSISTSYKNEFFKVALKIPGDYELESETYDKFVGKDYLSVLLVNPDYETDAQGFLSNGAMVTMLVNGPNFGTTRYPSDYVFPVTETTDGTLAVGEVDHLDQNKQSTSYHAGLTSKNGNFYAVSMYVANGEEDAEFFETILESIVLQ